VSRIAQRTQRRKCLKYLVATGLIVPVSLGKLALAHTPYRQWEVYRRKHLLIGCHKDVDVTYTLAREVVSMLDAHLPTAQARVARGPTSGRLASLLATEQLDVAIVSPADARAMSAGTQGFEPYGAIDLRLLLPLDDFLLVCRADFPASHAWLVSEALSDFNETTEQVDMKAVPLKLHAGAKAYFDGMAQPPSVN